MNTQHAHEAKFSKQTAIIMVIVLLAVAQAQIQPPHTNYTTTQGNLRALPASEAHLADLRSGTGRGGARKVQCAMREIKNLK